jgi:hypothetical protein
MPMALHLITNINDKFSELVKQDPVRSSIPIEQRIGVNRDIFVSHDIADQVKAITCVSYQNTIPTQESELFASSYQPNIVVFYTIWSYQPGAGRELIVAAQHWIRKNRPEIKRFVTLSPSSEMARHFHIKNGARIYRTNLDTVNYEYL